MPCGANRTRWQPRAMPSSPRRARGLPIGRLPCWGRSRPMPVKRGDIYWVDFEPVGGSESGERRPALVVQNDLGNSFSPTTVVVAVTRTIPPRPYPFAVVIEPTESGLPDRG